jgi:hypothetical protein
MICLFFLLICFFISLRKGNDELRNELSKIIVPIYCLAVDQSNDERKQKLVKVEILNKNWMRIFSLYLLKFIQKSLSSYSIFGKKTNISMGK